MRNIEKRNMANTEKDHHLNITNAIEVGDITATAIVAHVPVIVETADYAKAQYNGLLLIMLPFEIFGDPIFCFVHIIFVCLMFSFVSTKKKGLIYQLKCLY